MEFIELILLILMLLVIVWVIVALFFGLICLLSTLFNLPNNISEYFKNTAREFEDNENKKKQDCENKKVLEKASFTITIDKKDLYKQRIEKYSEFKIIDPPHWNS
jgi:RNA binding exosome subunit